MDTAPRQFEGDGGRPKQASIASGLLLTVVAWFLSRLTVGVALGESRNPFSFTPSLWTRVDSFNYLLIAEHGSTFGPCPLGSVPRYFGIKHCGSAAWLPGYPWVIRALHSTGISFEDCGLLISWLAMAVAIFLVWLGWARALSKTRALLLLVLFGVFPGAVYNFALFPTSLALALVVGAILAATRKRSAVTALLMVCAGLCYPSAWFAAGGLAIGIIMATYFDERAELVPRALLALAGLGSLLVLGFYDAVTVGHVNAYFLLQGQSGGQPKTFPGQEFLLTIFKRNTAVQQQIGAFGGAMLAVQAIVAFVVAGLVALTTAIGWRRRDGDTAELYPALVGVVVFLSLVLLSNAGAWTRSVVLAAPCVVCLRRIPTPLLGALVVGVGVTTALMSRSFFLFYGP